MAVFGADFDMEAIPEPVERKEFAPLPAGRYMMQIIDSGMKPTKKDPKVEMLTLRMEIMEGEHARRLHFENLNVNNPNMNTAQWARETLAKIWTACGRPNLKNEYGENDSAKLHFIPFYADVEVARDKRNDKPAEVEANGGPFPPQNRVKAWVPLDPSQVNRTPTESMQNGAPAVPVQRAFSAGSPPNGTQGGAGGFASTGGGAGAPTAGPRPASGALPGPTGKPATII